MNSNLDKVRARARLLLAADKWRELIQFLERDVPTLVAEVEQLQRELAEARSYEGRLRLPPSASRGPAACRQGSNRKPTADFEAVRTCDRRQRGLRPAVDNGAEN